MIAKPTSNPSLPGIEKELSSPRLCGCPNGFGLRLVTACIGAVLALFFLGSSRRVFAQSGALDYKYTQNTADGTLRSHARVDPSTLGMSFQIPLGAYPGRGGSGLPVNLYYSSKVWNVNYMFTREPTVNGPDFVPPPGPTYTVLDSAYGQHSVHGWMCSLTAPHIEWIGYINETYEFRKPKPCTPAPTSNPCEYISRIRVYMPDGSSHELRKDDLARDARTLLDRTGIFYSVDGSRIKFDAGWNTLFMPDGSRYLFTASQSNEQTATQYIDRNGNVLSYNLNTRQWADSVGRVINPVLPVEPDMGGQNYTYDPNRIAAGDYTYTLPGVAGAPITFHLIWKRLADALTVGAALRYRGDYSLNTVNNSPLPGPYLFTSLAANRIAVEDQLFNPVVLAEVKLPNLLSYKFTYNIYGEMDKVVYPTGGYEKFVYGEIPGLTHLTPIYAQANRGVVDHLISPSGSGLDESHWQYSVAATSPYTVVQIAPDGTGAPNGTRTERLLHPGRDNLSIKFGFDDARGGMAYEERAYAFTGGPMLRRALTQWTWDGPTTGGEASAMRDQRVAKQVEILLDTGGDALTKTTAFDYDSKLNVIRTYRYDFWPLDQQTAQTGDISLMPAGLLIRKEETDYLNSAAYRARQLIGLPIETRVKNTLDQVVARTQILYDELSYPILSYGSVTGWIDPAIDPATTARGNATTTRQWLDTNNSYLETHAQYDQFGSPRKSWDARGFMSEIQYSSVYQYAYPTTTTTPAPDPGGVCGCGSTAGFSTNYQFDFTTGLATSMTDANGVVTNFYYNDPFNRLTQVVRAAGGGLQNQTTVFHDDANHQVVTTGDQTVYGDNLLKSVVFYDGLGRTIESREYESATAYVTTEQVYDSMGRVSQTSNPYRPLASEARLTTTTAYDALGRVTSVTTPDNANVTTAYAGNQVLATDQAGMQRMSKSNALGQLTDVWEIKSADSATEAVSFPNHPEVTWGYHTSYLYDTLDDLISVTQGSQTRRFAYDSLKRLIFAANPEQTTSTNSTFTYNSQQWAVKYEYDSNSNLQFKTDTRLNGFGQFVKVSYVYDGLNRITSRSYNDGTPGVTYKYDGAGVSGGVAYSPGRLTLVSSNVSSYSYDEYDQMGRVKRCTQTTGQPYPMSYGYDLAGNMISESYPSGRIISTSYDSAGRLAGVNGQKTGELNQTYASQFAYWSHGAVKSMQLGNSKWEHADFNNRLQPTLIGVGTSSTDSSLLKLEYTYSNSNPAIHDNNGNVLTQKITGAGVFTQSYTYDALNRLSSATETGWSENFGYDRYGNMWVSSFTGITLSALTPQSSSAFSTANNNRLEAPSQYDAAGNLITDALSRTFGYDAENRQKDFNNNAVRYIYDGDGRRVEKIEGSNTTVFVYNVAGQLIAEYTSGAVELGGGTTYLAEDHLGSVRLTMHTSGDVKSRHDYLPFGEEVTINRSAFGGYVSDNLRQKFTQKERDSESGLDYFLARYYSSAQGRFTSIDPLALTGRRLLDPQQINLYAYARNNPLNVVDPDGENTITVENQTYSFLVEKRDGDLLKQVKVTVTETTRTERDDDGNLVGKQTFASATAANTDQANIRLSGDQLKTVARVASVVVEEAGNRGVQREVALGIAARETFFGTAPRKIAFEFQAPKVNPLQLTTDSGKQPTTDLRLNIMMSLDHFKERGSLQRYGPGPGNPGGATYAADVGGYINQIKAGISGSIRVSQPYSRQTFGNLLLPPTLVLRKEK